MTGPRKILVAGYYGAKNAGDEAILAGLLASFREAGFTGEFTVLSHDPVDTQALHGVAAVDWNDIEAIIDAAEQTDLVVVGGGGLFHDYWGVDPSSVLTRRQGGIAQYATPVYLAAMLGKPCALLGVGVGPLHTAEGRDLTRTIFDLADIAFVRDQGSLELLKTIGASVEHIKVGSDLAFASPRVDLPPSAAAFLSSLRRPVLGVALRHWTFGVAGDSWEAEVAEAIDRWQETTGGTPLFVPMQTGSSEIEDDAAVARRMIGRLGMLEKAALLPEGLNALERFWAVGACDLVLGMRMHAIVASVRSGVPCVGLAYDPKVEALESHSGQGALILAVPGHLETLVRALLSQGAATSQGTAAENSGVSLSSREQIAATALSLMQPARPTSSNRPRMIGLPDVFRRSVRDQARLARLESELRDTQQLRETEQGEAEETRRRLKEGLDAAVAENEVLTARSAALAWELQSLRSTLSVQLLARYWALARRVAPPGSPQRSLYGKVRSRFFGGLRGGRSSSLGQSPLPDVARPSGQLSSFFAAAEGDRPPFLILAPTAFRLSEGQRSTNMALELSRRGHPVVFAYWRWAAGDVSDPSPENVFQVPLDVVERDPRAFLGGFPDSEAVLLAEFPYPGLFETVAFARGRGWRIVYDAVDNWAEFHRVGQAPWYDRDFETHLVRSAGKVIAVTQRLADRLKGLGRDDIVLVPNGARSGAEQVAQPVELPRGEITLGYFGHMTSAWFDWDLVERVAIAQPKWRFYLIGYGSDVRRRLPANVALLGRIPAARLASYAAHWDVGIVPFIASDLAADADPIKTYEYLAMGLPVVVTGCEPPPGAEAFVRKAVGMGEFIEHVRLAAGESAIAPARRIYAMQNVWSSRADRMLMALSSGNGGAGAALRTTSSVG